MGESPSLEFIGSTLRAIQAEQRTLRGDQELLRKEIGRLANAMATRDVLLEVLTVITDRIANFEALTEARFDQLLARLPERGSS